MNQIIEELKEFIPCKIFDLISKQLLMYEDISMEKFISWANEVDKKGVICKNITELSEEIKKYPNNKRLLEHEQRHVEKCNNIDYHFVVFHDDDNNNAFVTIIPHLADKNWQKEELKKFVIKMTAIDGMGEMDRILLGVLKNG